MADQKWDKDAFDSLFHKQAALIVSTFSDHYPNREIIYDRPTRHDFGVMAYSRPSKGSKNQILLRSGRIECSTGFPFALFDACSTMASHPTMWLDSVFCTMDQISDNSSDYHESNNWLLDYSHLRQDEEFRPRFTTTNRQRAAIGDTLFWLATEFILLHECGHLILGHVDWSRWQRGFEQSHAVEKNQSLSTYLRGGLSATHVRRAFEIEADLFATHMLAGNPRSVKDGAGTHPNPKIAKIRLLLAGIGIAMCINSRSRPQIKAMAKMHPEAGARYLGCALEIINRVIHSGIFTPEEVVWIDNKQRFDFTMIAMILGAASQLRPFRVTRSDTPNAEPNKLDTDQQLARSVPEDRAIRVATRAHRQLIYAEVALGSSWHERMSDGYTSEITAPKRLDDSYRTATFAAQSLFNAHHAVGATSQPAKLIRKTMQTVLSINPKEEVAEALSRALSDAATAELATSIEIKGVISELEELMQRFPGHREVARSLSTALWKQYEVNDLAADQRLLILQQVGELACAPGATASERVVLAGLLANAILDTGDDSKAVYSLLGELHNLLDTDTENEALAERVARGTMNAVTQCPKNIDLHLYALSKTTAMLDRGIRNETTELHHSRQLTASAMMLSLLGDNVNEEQIIEICDCLASKTLRLGVWSQLDGESQEFFGAAFLIAAKQMIHNDSKSELQRLEAAAIDLFGKMRNPLSSLSFDRGNNI